MKKIYETFDEIADDFLGGNSWTHVTSNHSSDDCVVWQTAIREFCCWLDRKGVKIIENPEIYDKLWDW